MNRINEPWLTLLLAAGLGWACASVDPSERLAREARALGLHHEVVIGERFEHVVYARPDRTAERPPHPGRLHVYLDGDGTPWTGGLRWRGIRRTFVSEPARDPTPRNPLVLRLLALDPGPALYLGRPCYHGRARAPGCGPDRWTSERYSEPVVRSLAQALRRIRSRHRDPSLVLIGFSGGGTLAALLAARVEGVRGVLTIAGNLDTQAWSEHHGYEPLTGSLNPARLPALPPGVRQHHLVGDRDANVPAALLREALAGQKDATLEVVEGFTHICCWEQMWPELLDRLTRGLL